MSRAVLVATLLVALAAAVVLVVRMRREAEAQAAAEKRRVEAEAQAREIEERVQRVRTDLLRAVDERLFPSREELERGLRELPAGEEAAAGLRETLEGGSDLLAGDVTGSAPRLERGAEQGEVLAGYLLGHLLLAAGDRAGAAVRFRDALALRPDWLPAAFGLAVARMGDGGCGGGEETLREAAARFPDRAEVAAALARCRDEEGEREEALSGYARALELGAMPAEAVDRYTTLALEGGRTEEAKRLLFAQVQAAPARGDLRRALGRIHAAARDLGPARIELEAAIARGQTGMETRILLAQVEIEARAPERALAALAPVTEADARVLSLRAHAAVALDHPDVARGLFLQSCAGGLPASCEEACRLGEPKGCEALPPERRRAIASGR